MIYLFEDKSETLLPTLFRRAYPEDVSAEFVYSRGNAKLLSTASKLLSENEGERVLVFIDIAPDNQWTVSLYNELCAEFTPSNRRLLTIPIINSEYYFIRTIAKSHLVLDEEALRICLGIHPWRNARLVESSTDKQFCRNFEKFCKLFLLKAVKDCAKTTPFPDNSNLLYKVYYEKDCLCTYAESYCKFLSGVDKACSFVREFPCFPPGINRVKGVRDLSVYELIRLNHAMCSLCNTKIEEFSKTREKLNPLPG